VGCVASSRRVFPDVSEECVAFSIRVSSSMESNMYRGADKSLARPGRKQARKHVREARDFNNIETREFIGFFSPCKAGHRRKFTPF